MIAERIETNSTRASATSSDRELVMTRVLSAPRELVFKAWTDPKHIAQWWGPRGFTTTTHEMNVKPGGVWRFIMHGPDGVDYPNRIVYFEVVKPERLVYVHGADEENDPEKFHVTITFDEQGDRTRITMRSLFASAAQFENVKKMGAVEGGKQTLDRLAEHVVTMAEKKALTLTFPSDREVVFTRVFNAPRRLVFEAWTTPEHVTHWFGPRGYTLPVCKIDLRPGGAWRYIMRGPDGREMGMKGVYREIVPYDRLVSTESFDDYPGESVNTMTLEERDGKTTMTVRVLYESPEMRDGVLESGMEKGAGETLDRLAEHVGGMA